MENQQPFQPEEPESGGRSEWLMPLENKRRFLYRTEPKCGCFKLGFSRQEYWSELPFPSPSFYKFCPNLWLTLMIQKQGRLPGDWLRINEPHWDLNCYPADGVQPSPLCTQTGQQNVTGSRISTHHSVHHVQEAHPISFNTWRNREVWPFSKAKTLRWSRR